PSASNRRLHRWAVILGKEKVDQVARHLLDWSLTVDNVPALNYFCPAFKEFFAYAIPRLEEVAADLQRGRRFFPDR
ncbi:MAG: hypothetical protein IKM31_09325, partial [Oscillospiraceae bacterium]|nr:hypothetical protein [Oscillospiraceae bacterium]